MKKRRSDVVTVGLTGGIGAGKSTALAMFAELGALTFSADRVVHELYQSEPCRTALAAHFGRDVLTSEGLVDRRRLARLVQGRTEELRWLERLTHPLVRERLQSFVEQAPSGSVVVCEVPLLFEAGYESLFDLVVSVEASPEVRRQRSVHDFGPELFGELEALQSSTARRTAGSDLVFVNDGSEAELRAFVEGVYQQAHDRLRQANSR